MPLHFLKRYTYTILETALILVQMVLYYRIFARAVLGVRLRDLLHRHRSLPSVFMMTKMFNDKCMGIVERNAYVFAQAGMLIVIIFIYLCGSIIISLLGLEVKAKNHREIIGTFDVLFDIHIRSKFRSQNPESLSCLKNGVKSAMGAKSTRRPALLVLLHTEQSRSTAEALSSRLLRVCLAAVGRQQSAAFVEKELIVQGSDYSSVSDFWTFFNDLRDKVEFHKMAILRDFQSVHPHAVTLVNTLTHEVFSPVSKAVVVVLLEMPWYVERPGECPSQLAESWVDRYFSHALDEGARQDLVRAVTARAAIIKPETTLPFHE